MNEIARAIAVRNARSYRNSLASATNSSAIPPARSSPRWRLRSDATTRPRPTITHATDTATCPCWKPSCTAVATAPSTRSWKAPRIAAASVHSTAAPAR